MSDTSDLIGQVRKLDGRPVVIIGVSGNDVQVDHWAGSPWTPMVHVDRLGEMPPWIWTDERLAVLRQQAVERLGVWNDARALALGTLSLIHAFEAREKCAEDVEKDLAEEGKALDDVVLERDEAWKLIHNGFSDARIPGFELGKSTTLNEAAEQAADAIREFGILNRELAAVNAALQPVAGNGESLSACVARLVKRLAEQDAELARLRGESCTTSTEAPIAEAIVATDAPQRRPFTINGGDEIPTNVDLVAEMAVTNGDDELAESIADFREASAAVKESLQGVIDGMTELVAMTSQDEPALDNLSIRAKQVLDHLRGTGPQRGEQIRKHFGLGSSDWNKVKGELLDAKVIRKFGEARGAQYEAIA